MQNNINTLKEKNENTIEELLKKISDTEKTIANNKNNFEQNLALKEQELNYINENINDKQNELNEFQQNFDLRINQCREETTKEYNEKLNVLKEQKNDLENQFNDKKKQFKDLEMNYNSEIALLEKEKDVLLEKLNNVTNQTNELESNLEKERNENLVKLSALKKECKEKNEQLLKENETIVQKLNSLQDEYNELAEEYEKDKTLWENKYKNLLDEKDTANDNLNKFKSKYNQHTEYLQSKLENDQIEFQQVYNDAFYKNDEKFNEELRNNNKYFVSKFEVVNKLNKELIEKNLSLIEKLNELEGNKNIKEKETELALLNQNINRYKIYINNIAEEKDKEIDRLQKKILEEKKSYSLKLMEMQKKLRDYEMKRTVFTNDNLKQKTESEKENDEQTLQIQRLRNKINQLEKSNFRLQLDNRETQKDMKNLKRKNHSSLGNINYVPKYKTGKENNRTQSNLPPEFINRDFNLNNTNKKSVFHQKGISNVGLGLDNDEINHSNNGSVIMNSSDLEVEQE